MINLHLIKFFWINFVLLNFLFSFLSFAQEEFIERDEKYLITQSMKFGKNRIKNVYFSDLIPFRGQS